jgi:hypothetical protein
LGIGQFDRKNQIITQTVITLSCFHCCTTLGQAESDTIKRLIRISDLLMIQKIK